MRASANLAKKILGDNLRVAEIGVSEGRNAVDMLDGLSIERFYAVDPYLPFEDVIYGNPIKIEAPIQARHYRHMFMSLSRYLHKVVLLTRTSEFASALIPAYSLDYVYIDANHSYESVRQDLKFWWPKVRQGGIFAGHDQTFPGVKKAVQEFAELIKLPVEIADEDWIIRKHQQEQKEQTT